MFEVKEVTIVNENGKRSVKVANAIRSQMFDKIMEILSDEGFEVTKAANGDIAIKTVIDQSTGDVYYTRLAVSLSAKDLEHKTVSKSKAKVEKEEVEVNLFEV